MQEKALDIEEKVNVIVSLFDQSISQKQNQTILNSYVGSLNDHIVEEFASRVEKEMTSHGIKKKYVKNYFSIVIEALQNIRIHGFRNQSMYHSDSYVIASTKQGYYTLETCNIIENKNSFSFIKKNEH